MGGPKRRWAVRLERRGCGCRSSSASGCWSGGPRQLGVGLFAGGGEILRQASAP